MMGLLKCSIFSMLFLSGFNGVLANEELNWTTPDKDEISACYLMTPKKVINDGQGETNVWLEFNEKELLIKTKSDIDKSFGDIEIKVDGKNKVTLDDIRSNTDVVFSKSIGDIKEQFIKGENVRVQLRFWPTWPTTGAKNIDFSLLGFTKAYEEFLKCKTTGENNKIDDKN